MNAKTVRYDAFLSYSHAKDKALATALQSIIQRIGKPWYRRRAVRVFRDDTSLSATPHLWPTIEQALSESRFLILVASSEAAASPWVAKEVLYWIDHKRIDNLLIALTDGELSWDGEAGDFRWSDLTPLPPVLVGRLPHEPKWIDLRGHRGGGNFRDARFIEAAADFAATVQGIPKEDLLSQEVRQQRRALALAGSGAALLLALSLVAGWQWNVALKAEHLASARRTEAEGERDRAQEALAVAAARESTLLVRQGLAEEAWTNLRRALAVNERWQTRDLPAAVLEAGLLALIENRLGPELNLELGAKSAAALEHAFVDTDEPNTIGAFDADSKWIAIGELHDVAIWSTSDGRLLRKFETARQVVDISFSASGNFLLIVGRTEAKDRKDDQYDVTIMDVESGRSRTGDLRWCQEVLPCAGEPSRPGQPLTNIYESDKLWQILQGTSLPPLFVPFKETHRGYTYPIEYLGRIANRYYVFQGTGGDTISVFDAVPQRVAVVKLPEVSSRIAVARDKLLLVTAQNENVSYFRLEFDPKNGAKAALRLLRKLKADDYVSRIQLSDDGSRAYYETGSVGSSGRGGGTVGVLDLETGKSAWINRFSGRNVISARQQFIARSAEDGHNGMMMTQFVNGQTAERLFSVPGMVVSIDQKNRTAAVEMPAADNRSRSRRVTKLRLVELSTTISFANEGRWPQGLRQRCEVQPPFRVLEDRDDRAWNAMDWRRAEPTPPTAQPRAEDAEDAEDALPPMYVFRWAGNDLTVSGPEVLGNNKGTLAEIALLLPRFADLIEPGVDMSLTEVLSPDKRFAGVQRKRYGPDFSGRPPDIDWKIYRVDGSSRIEIAHGTTSNGAGSIQTGIPGVLFVENLNVAFVNDDACTLRAIHLADGAAEGTLRSTIPSPWRIASISDDLIAVWSRGEHSGSSIQIFEFPSLAPGPVLMNGDEDDLTERSRNRPPALVSFKDTTGPFLDHGKFLSLRREGADPIVLSVPPWGKRLRDFLMSR